MDRFLADRARQWVLCGTNVIINGNYYGCNVNIGGRTKNIIQPPAIHFKMKNVYVKSFWIMALLGQIYTKIRRSVFETMNVSLGKILFFSLLRDHPYICSELQVKYNNKTNKRVVLVWQFISYCERKFNKVNHECRVTH